MAGERKQIRDSVKALIEPIYNGLIETNLYVDAQDLDDYVHVYLQNGQISADGMDQVVNARLLIGYYTKTRDDDDAIDAIAEQIEEKLNEPRVLPTVRGVTPVRFEYVDEQESEFSGIELEFTVTYSKV